MGLMGSQGEREIGPPSTRGTELPDYDSIGGNRKGEKIEKVGKAKENHEGNRKLCIFGGKVVLLTFLIPTRRE